MLKKLFSRRLAGAGRRGNVDAAGKLVVSNLESLETRVLMAATPAHAIGVVADNRGECVINTSIALQSATITRRAVEVFSAGTDRRLGTADDVKLNYGVHLINGGKRIAIRVYNLTLGDGYRVKLTSSRIKDANGLLFDGEYSGRLPTGNGVQGGNFEFQTKNDRSIAPQVQMSTDVGVITIKMFRDAAPLSVDNFFRYANSGRYDNIFFTRSIASFIVQGGSLRVNNNGSVTEPSAFPKVKNEPGVSNTRGTISFAKPGNDPNGATNQFFFNLGDNSSNLDSQNGGFTVFGKIANSSGLAAMDAIAGHDTVALHNDVTGHGVLPSFPDTGLTDVPVSNKNLMTGQTETIDPQFGTQAFVVTGGFDAQRDLVKVRRTAVLQRIGTI